MRGSVPPARHSTVRAVARRSVSTRSERRMQRAWWQWTHDGGRAGRRRSALTLIRMIAPSD
jgi:hypothetical protein